jgi:hypothetical protein
MFGLLDFPPTSMDGADWPSERCKLIFPLSGGEFTLQSEVRLAWVVGTSCNAFEADAPLLQVINATISTVITIRRAKDLVLFIGLYLRFILHPNLFNYSKYIISCKVC